MKNYVEIIYDQTIMNKVMCNFSFKFDYIVVTIEESIDMFVMKVEELQYFLEAHEQMVFEKSQISSDQIRSTNLKI